MAFPNMLYQFDAGLSYLTRYPIFIHRERLVVAMLGFGLQIWTVRLGETIKKQID